MHSNLCTRVSTLHVPKSPTNPYFGPWGVKSSQQRLDGTSENGPSPSGLRGAVATVEGGALPSLVGPAFGCGKPRPSGMLLLMVADVVRLSQVTKAGLGARDPTYHPPLWGLVSPQNVVLSAYTKGSIRQRMVQNAFAPADKSLHTKCPKITRGVLILAPGGSRGHSKDWTVTLENGPSPSALRGAAATVGEGGGACLGF